MATTRTAERAAAILERAARMKAFRPSLLDRRLFDKQMKTPGALKGAGPLGNLNTISNDRMRYAGMETVAIKDIKATQKTVSLAVAKQKAATLAAGGQLAAPLVFRHANGTLEAMDGNHGLTGRRALGQKTVAARIVELKSATAPSTVFPAGYNSGKQGSGAAISPGSRLMSAKSGTGGGGGRRG